MKDDSHLYLDVFALQGRGWTETLVKRFLGKPDQWATVDHWANYAGKRTYFLERVQQAEKSESFCEAFSKSVRRRKLKMKVVSRFMKNRKSTENHVEEWRLSLTSDDIKSMEVIEKMTEIMEEARRRGYRTPHK